MLATLTPQEAVDRGPKPSECDFVVIVLWGRFGTPLATSLRKPTGEPFLSGTEWEYEDAISAKRRPEVLIYRCTQPVKLDADDPDLHAKLEQRKRVIDFFKQFQNPDGSYKGGVNTYDTPHSFGEILKGHLRTLLATKLISEAKSVPVAPLRAVLEKLGAAELPMDEIPKRLAAAADELVALRRDLERLRNDRPELAAVRSQALALIDAGDLDAARSALNRGREAARALREETSRNEAEFLSDEARIDHLQLAYRNAAQKYAQAAALVAPSGPEAEWPRLEYLCNCRSASPAKGPSRRAS
jgi:hypothetical protein